MLTAHGLKIAPSTYYAAKSRPPSARAVRDVALKTILVEVDHPLWGAQTFRWGVTGLLAHRESAQTERFVYDLDGGLAYSFATEGWLTINIGAWQRDHDGLSTADTHYELHWTQTDPPIDFMGRITQRDDAGLVTSYGQLAVDASFEPVQVVLSALGRDPAGRIVAESFGSVTADGSGGFDTVASERAYTYDPAGQLTDVEDTAENTSLAAYDYDAHGRRSTHTDPTGSTAYTWDDLGRLTDVDHPSGPDTTYTYDGAGRRQTETRGDLEVAYTYGPDGRLTARDATDDATPAWSETRAWDPAGRLAEITHTHGATTTVDTLGWDPTGPVDHLQRWTHHDGTTTHNYTLYRGETGAPRGDNHTGMHVVDAHGSHRDLWEPNFDHTLGGANDYTPWGQPTDPTGQHTYLGYRSEIHTGDLIHLRNRDYDPSTGTFTTPDPLDGVDGTPTVANPYHYADNNPLNKTDPLGLRPGDGEGPFSPIGGMGFGAAAPAPVLIPLAGKLLGAFATGLGALAAIADGGPDPIAVAKLAEAMFPQFNGGGSGGVHTESDGRGCGDVRSALEFGGYGAGAMAVALQATRSVASPDGTPGDSNNVTNAVAVFCVERAGMPSLVGTAVGRSGAATHGVPEGFVPGSGSLAGGTVLFRDAETNVLAAIEHAAGLRAARLRKGWIVMFADNKICNRCIGSFRKFQTEYPNLSLDAIGFDRKEPKVWLYQNGTYRSHSLL